ncbi:MAG: hypothetical protein ABSH35_20115 [Isosphaeraceae bacterium]|jgi:hypothetical protein
MAEPEYISLIHLIQHPHRYHGRKVRVIGVVRLKFESKAVFVSAEDLKKAVTKNAIWLDVDLTEANQKLSGKHVLVEGVFDQENLGHLKLYSGAITKVTRLEEWRANVKD